MDRPARLKKALKVFQIARSKKVQFDRRTGSLLVQACLDAERPEDAFKALKHAADMNITPTLSAYHKAVYNAICDEDEAMINKLYNLFFRFPVVERLEPSQRCQLPPNRETYQLFIGWYALSGDIERLTYILGRAQ